MEPSSTNRSDPPRPRCAFCEPTNCLCAQAGIMPNMTDAQWIEAMGEDPQHPDLDRRMQGMLEQWALLDRYIQLGRKVKRLKTYVAHRVDCHRRRGGDCTCGLQALLSS